MSIDNLLEYLSQLPAIFDQSFAAMQHMNFAIDETERPNSRLGPVDVKSYADDQQKCLAALRDSASDVVNSWGSLIGEPAPEGFMLFATGSIARLEFLSHRSDVDLLAIVAQNPTRVEAMPDTRVFTQFEEKLAARVSSALGVTPEDISVNGCPVHIASDSSVKEGETAPDVGGRWRKRFYTEADLIDNLGRDFEAAWAAFERCSLLFESAVLVSAKETAPDSLRARIDQEVYKICDDLQNQRFPLVGHCLAQYHARSGLLSKAASVRKATEGSIARSELAKAVLGRVWSANINLLTLHILYWYQLIVQDPEVKVADLLSALREPPVWRVIRSLSWRMQKIRERMGAKVPVLLRNEGAAKDVITVLEQVQERIRPGGSNDRKPLWFHFLQLMNVCKQLREDKLLLTDDVAEKILACNRELSEIVQLSYTVTRALACTQDPSAEMVRQLHRLLADHLHGSDV